MRIERVDPHNIQIGPLDLLFCELLHQIRLSVDYSSDIEVRERFFPSPTGGATPRIDADWREYVEPELAASFDTSLQVIDEDLANFPPPSPPPTGLGYFLSVPLKHLDAWIHGLTQARIALAARYNFTEDDMNGKVPTDGDDKALALFQEHFYGLLLESFIRIQEAIETGEDNMRDLFREDPEE